MAVLKNNRHKNEHLQSIYNRALRNNQTFTVEIIKDGLTKEEAIALEIELIAKYGRRDLGTGTLANKTPGGEGYEQSEFTKQKLSKIVTEHHKNSPRPQEVLDQISRSLTGRKHSEETKKEMSRTRKGPLHPMFGRKHSEETKKHWSKTRKGKKSKEETKEKISKSIEEHWEKRRLKKEENGG